MRHLCRADQIPRRQEWRRRAHRIPGRQERGRGGLGRGCIGGSPAFQGGARHGAGRQRAIVEGEHHLMVLERQALVVLHDTESGMLDGIHNNGATGPDCVRVSGTFRGCGGTGHQHCYGHDRSFQVFHISHAERYTTDFVENRGLNEIVEGAIRCTWAAILMAIICLFCSDEAPTAGPRQ